MEMITSKQNEKIINAKKLLEKKYRDKTNLFLVETKKVVSEALSAGLLPKIFFVTDKKRDEIPCEFNGITYVVTESVIRQISSVVSPDGIVAVFEKKEQKKEYNGGKFLLLDELQNPDNFGAILRTALACDFKQIYTVNCVDEYSPKVIRSSMGNQFKLKIIHIEREDIPKLFLNAKLYTLSMEGKNLFCVESFDINSGFVVGNEGNGVSQIVKDYCDQVFSIPMENDVESLNASISASVAMYYVFSKK